MIFLDKLKLTVYLVVLQYSHDMFIRFSDFLFEYNILKEKLNVQFL